MLQERAVYTLETNLKVQTFAQPQTVHKDLNKADRAITGLEMEAMAKFHSWKTRTFGPLTKSSLINSFRPRSNQRRYLDRLVFEFEPF